MIERTWKTMVGKKTVDLKSEIRALMAESPDRELIIGTDSQNAGNITEYITVVIILRPGKGGRCFFCRERVPRIKSLRERLMKEVWMSVELGLELNGEVPEAQKLTIHIDANPDVQYKSSDVVQEMVGLVLGQGFGAVVKPDAWAASHAADHIVKGFLSRS
jgi:predicted RNase H-related nuclease YkuK (DUF458 family)